jgi:hypothetical protein
VHEDLVTEVIAIFEQLHQLRYPIEKIRAVNHYPGADDELSMEDNNTSAFNCRGIPGTRRWSQHAYGRAIDLNPLLNPYINRAHTPAPTPSTRRRRYRRRTARPAPMGRSDRSRRASRRRHHYLAAELISRA